MGLEVYNMVGSDVKLRVTDKTLPVEYANSNDLDLVFRCEEEDLLYFIKNKQVPGNTVIDAINGLGLKTSKGYYLITTTSMIFNPRRVVVGAKAVAKA